MRVVSAALILLITACSTTPQTSEDTSFIYPPWRHTWGVTRATPFKLRLFVGDRTRFNDPQGLACVRLFVWDDTSRTGDDDELTVYGVNSGDRCLIYNRSMYSLGIYGLGGDEVHFYRPWGVAGDDSGRVVVSDRDAGRLVELWNDGQQLTFVRFIPEESDSTAQLLDPCGVAFAPDGRLFVADEDLGSVVVFSRQGRVMQVWNGFNGPDAVAVTGPGEKWTYYRDDGFILVIDSLHQRVNKLTLNGKLIGVTTARAIGASDAWFAWVALDYHNNILITDRKNNCIHKLDRDLNHLTSYGRSEVAIEPLDEPRGIAVHRRFGQVFVAEREGARYLWVAVDVRNFRTRVRAPDRWRDLDVDFYLTEPALAQMDILDQYGRFIARIADAHHFQAGDNHLAWSLVVPTEPTNPNQPSEISPDLRRGEIFPPGRYQIRARFRATYSSREHYAREVSSVFIVP